MSLTANESPDSPDTLAAALRRFVTHASPRFLLTALAITLAARIATGAWSAADAIAVGLILALWPLQEWLIHVFMLHFEPITLFGRTLDFEVPRSHRVHHRRPWDLDILFIPLQGYFIGIPPLVLLAFGLLPTSGLALTAVGFYLLLTLRYEWTHFLVHTRYRPRSRHYRRLWRNHRLHHCKNEHYWYGVSMLSADTLLGTAPELTAVETSPTCRSLGIAPPADA